MHVILSVPIPSEVAMLDGHILSIIISMILANPNPPTLELVPLDEGDSFLVGLFLPAAWTPFLVV